MNRLLLLSVLLVGPIAAAIATSGSYETDCETAERLKDKHSAACPGDIDTDCMRSQFYTIKLWQSLCSTAEETTR